MTEPMSNDDLTEEQISLLSDCCDQAEEWALAPDSDGSKLIALIAACRAVALAFPEG